MSRATGAPAGAAAATRCGQGGTPGHAVQALIGVTLELGFDYPDGYHPRLTPEELLIIQERYLVEQLRLLDDDRSTGDTRQDALDWVAERLVPDRVMKYLGPLSFQRCCREAHEVDPAIVQERVLRQVAPDRLAALGYE